MMLSMAGRIWMRHEFPWLGRGFIHAVAEAYAEGFTGELVAREFDLFVFRGDRMTDPSSFWNEIRMSFKFPDYFGGNWDAVTDCLRDIELPPVLTLIWRRADITSAECLKLFAEAMVFFHSTFEEVESGGKQAEIVLMGTGLEFRQP
jgi:RNAse (barnase) inhibitor barstar